MPTPADAPAPARKAAEEIDRAHIDGFPLTEDLAAIIARHYEPLEKENERLREALLGAQVVLHLPHTRDHALLECTVPVCVLVRAAISPAGGPDGK